MSVNETSSVVRDYNRSRLIVLLFLLFVSMATSFEVFAEIFARAHSLNINLPVTMNVFLATHQDMPFLVLLLLALAMRLEKQTYIPQIAPWTIRAARLWPIVVPISLLFICWAGNYLVFDNYDLARDTQMADFDATIFQHGRLFWPISVSWRAFAPALNLTFILPIGDHQAWVSSYLPVNAAVRAVFSIFTDQNLTSPLFVALGAVALWRISLRLWPDLPVTRLVALTLFAGSSQIVITGMTSYAMSGHLGLNMLWLALFLRGRRAGHAGAIGVGFMATGLHQPLFHPLFALPFLDLLRQERRWRLLTIYLCAYALIAAFWMAWPIWISSHGSLPVAVGANSPGTGFVTRLSNILHPFNLFSVLVMSANLLRFATWQHLLLLPLLTLGIGASWRMPIFRALTIGFFLPIVVTAVVLPYQGHGWGYRYVHSVLGNACLLGAYGWHWLESHGYSLRRSMVVATAITLLICIPVHAWLAHRMVVPFAQLSRQLNAIDADIVILDDGGGVPFAGDLVINRPDLSNRPILLIGSQIKPSDIGALCRGRSVAFLDAPKLLRIAELFGSPYPLAASKMQTALEHAAQVDSCTVVSR